MSGQDADENGAAHFAHFKDHHEDEAEERKRSRGVADAAHADERCGIADDEAGVAEPDEGDEESDAAGDCGVEFMRNGAQNHLADSGGSEGEKDDAGEEDGAQRGLPGDMHLEADGVSEIGVEAHAGRECDGIARDDAHQNGTECRREAGGRRDRSERHPGGGENGGIDQDDVRHGQEGGDSGQNLSAPIGAQMSEFKIAFESFEHRRVSVEDHNVAATQRRFTDLRRIADDCRASGGDIFSARAAENPVHGAALDNDGKNDHEVSGAQDPGTSKRSGNREGQGDGKAAAQAAPCEHKE